MAVLIPTKVDGATSKANDVLYVEPERTVSDTDHESFGGGDLNGPFLAELMSAMLTHERCGTHLYRSVAARTANPVLRRRYEHFGAETERHVEVLEDLIEAAGGNPCYVSPMARATEAADTGLVEATFLVDGALDPVTREMAMLDAVLLAETMDHANWSVLADLVRHMPDGELRDRFAAACSEVNEQEDEHLGWAKRTKARLVTLEARSSVVASATAKAEELAARVGEWLSGE